MSTLDSAARRLRAFLENTVGSPYVYGGTMQPCTPSYRLARIEQYPGFASSIRNTCRVLSLKAAECKGCRYYGRYAFDCAQLVRYALKQIGTELPSGASSQWRHEKAWLFQGPITPLAATFPCVLFRKEDVPRGPFLMAHVGISLGDGFVIDARSHRAGVIRTRFTAYPWSHMAFPRGLPLPEIPGAGERAVLIETTPAQAKEPVGSPRDSLTALTLRAGQHGIEVRQMQSRLMMLGYPLPRYGADGKFGRETACAVVAFQKVAGLPADGVADPGTLGLLFPAPPPFEPLPPDFDEYEGVE